jgi:UTP--glucose-1-phosphate uridylyltransferase
LRSKLYNWLINLNVFRSQKLINKCLFPAAGYGTRFLPATKAVPKEMLPILTKPLLQYGIEEALSSGINNMAIVTGRGKRAIEDHFDNSFELESQLKGTEKDHYLTEINQIINTTIISYIRQKEMRGLGHAILTGQPLIGKEPFAVVLADDLCDCEDEGVLSQMIDIYNQYNCSIVALQEVPISETDKYGIVKGIQISDSKNIFQITNMVEKPATIDAPSNMAIIGRYILTPDIFSILEKIKPDNSGEIQITDALLAQAKKGNVIGLKFKGKRFDCGSVKGFVQATNYFANKEKLI